MVATSLEIRGYFEGKNLYERTRKKQGSLEATRRLETYVRDFPKNQILQAFYNEVTSGSSSWDSDYVTFQRQELWDFFKKSREEEEDTCTPLIHYCDIHDAQAHLTHVCFRHELAWDSPKPIKHRYHAKVRV